MTIGKLSGQCDFGQKGQSYCNQRGQSCVAKRVKVAWLFQLDHAFVASGVYPAFRSRSGLLDFYSLCDGNGGGFDHCLENTRDHPGESGGGTEG